ncbi:MAG: hypothetical protein JNL75_11690 [Chitinophagales bacterium]|nr:hypothetical protein [Chitinophagales bacterium]
MIPKSALDISHLMKMYDCPLAAESIVRLIANYWEQYRDQSSENILHLALSRAQRYTDNLWQPLSDSSCGQGYNYGLMIKKSGKPYSRPLQLYYPRGLFPLCWYENYEKLAKLTGYDILLQPDLLLTAEVSAAVLIQDIIHGVSVSDEYNTCSPLNLGRDI